MIAAVSGGGDSLALLLLLHEFLAASADAPALTAVTVDHGLRPEAAAEAQVVAELCLKNGISHRTLVWSTPRTGSGVQAAARDARLAMIAEMARELGADMVFTGHTQDDLAETVCMRNARGEGRGSAGIAPAALYEGDIWFVRPLLGVRRAALRAFLREKRVGWVDDPSNENMAFERVRTRYDLTDEAVTHLAGEAEKAAKARVDLGRRAAILIAENLSIVAPGLYRLKAGLMGSEDEKAALYAFRIIAAMVGGGAHLAGAAVSEKAFNAVGSGLCATLSRAVVDVRRAGIHLYRERRNLPVVQATGLVLWDGRYWLGANLQQEIAPFGDGARAAMREGAAGCPQDLLFAAQSGEPALRQENMLPSPARATAANAGIRVPAPWARLLPSFDLAPANALAEVFGAKTIISCHDDTTFDAEA
ncbi:tRNA(Ile)-lysidine synthetase [Nitratireductor indicus C115]|uniref:tRNA(Ile)-lysidine synthase n=1 Tax=Nitratireductor indicus C115 TaxID=1231190 RepID=K2N2X7_9HYPH|nr:tRNA lysidine(34) synthetase TilS [Nitratireductor indicus]EKF41773.1 tRNA(Ile)-lysidine synthetase [Nitratireductor indicus C115]SFQ67468.1 tRNA(Ile)-lysidine synthase [Nitratireductor indicus]